MNKKGLKLIMMCLLTSSSVAYAGWPIFNVLTPIEVNQLAIHQGCPTGKVRVLANTRVPIHARNLPPEEHWVWQMETNSQCFDPSKLQYLSIEQTGYVAPGIIKTNYGTINTAVFSFIFKIPKPPWDCGYFLGPSIPDTIGCAQDM